MTRNATTRSPRTRRTAGALALTFVAAGATTAVTGMLGVAPSTASADPGDTYVAIGSSRLVQSEDLVAIQVPLDTETVVLNRQGDFSSCLGEGNSWTQVLPGSPKPLTATWTRRGHGDQALFESIAQAKTEVQAQGWERILVRSAVRACRKPTTDFHYGPITSSGVGAGHATWAVSFTGDQTRPDGGVAVIRKGTSVGLVQVSGTWGPAQQMMESVAKVTVDRLG